MMLKQVVLAHFEPVATGLGSWKIPKCLENGPFWDQKWVKNGSKTRFSKSDPRPFGMLKQVFLARFEPVLTEFSPFHHMYAPLCALRPYLRAVWWSHLELGEGCRLEDIYIYIYLSSNLHPSPNSRWLHHTALRYVRRAQSGAYMWWKGLNSVKTGSKRAQNTYLSTPNGPRSLLEKRVFDPFLTHFWSQNGPFSRHFGMFHGPKRATTGSKRPKNTCLSIPSGPGTTLEKMIFFAPGTLVDPPLAPAVCGPGCPPDPPSDHWYGGLGGLLGDSETWKPQKVGGCGWTRCPRNSDLSHVAQDTARSWFRGVGAHCAVFGAFWRLFGPFLGHIVELGGNKELLVTVKSSRTWSVSKCLPSFGRCDGVSGRFWAKKGCFGAQNAQIWEGTSRLGAPAPGRHR